MGEPRIIPTAILTALLLSCGGSDPVGPSTGNGSEYYPLAVGNVWNYDRSGTISTGGAQMGTISGKVTVEITGTGTHSEGFEVFVREVSVIDTTDIYGQVFYSDSTFTEYLRLTGDALFGYRGLADTDSSFTVPFPFQLGATWTFREEPPTTGEILSLTATASVPAGSFTDCVEMQLVWMDSGMTVMNTADLARDVGEVRNVFVSTADMFATDITHSLETFILH